MTMAWNPPIRRAKRTGILQVSEELLKQVLHIPPDAKIRNIISDSNKNGIVSIIVESENLEDVEEGAVIPNVTLSQLTGYDE